MHSGEKSGHCFLEVFVFGQNQYGNKIPQFRAFQPLPCDVGQKSKSHLYVGSNRVPHVVETVLDHDVHALHQVLVVNL